MEHEINVGDHLKKQKKILLLTTIYPSPDVNKGTSVIHYFTREWVEMGYEVKVIHYQAVYPIIFYFMAKLFKEKIASMTGAVVHAKRDISDKIFMLDNVAIYRFPIFKIVPHGRFAKKVLENQLTKLKNIIRDEHWIPDIIIGHFPNPQLEIIHELKKIYHARTCMIMHWANFDIKRIYKNKHQEFMDSIDIWGYRSLPIQREFEKIYGKQKRSFLCYSGIPEKYIVQSNDREFYGDLKRFVYIGDLIKRKHPISLVYAICRIYHNNTDYRIIYIGEGDEKRKIQGIIDSLDIKEHVSFLGRVPRDNIPAILDGSECMIMISQSEALGLVYLESMGRGCITIGSKNEGIDGIIQNGINGFLCEAGNEQELANIIRHINSLTAEERKKISQNAIATAKELTDYRTALKYIESVNFE